MKGYAGSRPAMERMTGIEPARPAWKAGVLPLYDIRMVGVVQRVLTGAYYVIITRARPFHRNGIHTVYFGVLVSIRLSENPLEMTG